MPTVNVIPNSVASLALDEWTNSGGANKAASVAPGDAFPVTHDDMTTRIQGAGNAVARQQDVKCDSTEWPASIGNISDMSVGCRLTCDGAPSAKEMRYGIANASGYEYTSVSPVGGTTWETKGPTSKSKPGGGAWVAADCAENTTWLRCYGYTNDAQTHYVTSLWFQMTYTVGWGFVLGILFNVSGALPFAGALTDLGQFRQWLSHMRWLERRRIVQIYPGEVLRAWDELKAYPWPSYHYL